MSDPDAGSGPDAGTGLDASTDSDADSGVDTDVTPYRAALARFLGIVESLRVDGPALEAVVAAGLAGGFQAALVVQLYDTDAIKRVGAVAGAPTLDGGWLAMFALGVLFAVPFHVFTSGSLDAVVAKGLVFTRRSDSSRRILRPLLERSALATTTFGLGTGYGFVLGVLVLLPIWVAITTGTSTATHTATVAGVVGVVAWTTYGATLGLVYGSVLEYR
ncbi:hypothetical protein [Natrinema caseinilyticum]|uniref:hypothetical protein n=1 Tax=Natrinema caseinilyticum TaxID=2961570 RepID=UPI0020C44994|nr:hypothetical protein [Natrinema caseinilyticum]